MHFSNSLFYVYLQMEITEIIDFASHIKIDLTAGAAFLVIAIFTQHRPWRYFVNSISVRYQQGDP